MSVASSSKNRSSKEFDNINQKLRELMSGSSHSESPLGPLVRNVRLDWNEVTWWNPTTAWRQLKQVIGTMAHNKKCRDELLSLRPDLKRSGISSLLSSRLNQEFEDKLKESYHAMNSLFAEGNLEKLRDYVTSPLFQKFENEIKKNRPFLKEKGIVSYEWKCDFSKIKIEGPVFVLVRNCGHGLEIAQLTYKITSEQSLGVKSKAGYFSENEAPLVPSSEISEFIVFERNIKELKTSSQHIVKEGKSTDFEWKICGKAYKNGDYLQGKVDGGFSS